MVNIQSGVIRHPNNDYYTYATCSPFNPYCLTDGRIPFDFTPPLPQEYFLDPPPELCVPTMTADMWFEYIATCTGEPPWEDVRGQRPRFPGHEPDRLRRMRVPPGQSAAPCPGMQRR